MGQLGEQGNLGFGGEHILCYKNENCYAMLFGGDYGYKVGNESMILSACAESIILSASLLLPLLPTCCHHCCLCLRGCSSGGSRGGDLAATVFDFVFVFVIVFVFVFIFIFIFDFVFAFVCFSFLILF